MEQEREKLHPRSPLENKKFDLEQRLKKKINDVNSFNNSVNNHEEMITYIKDKKHTSKKNIKFTEH